MMRERFQTLDWRNMSIGEILRLAITDEEDVRDYYRRAAEVAGSGRTRRMLLNLAEMEQGHADQLRRELEQIKDQEELETGMAD